jgi:hypothetical protein
VFGKDAQGGEVALDPNTGGVLILGQSGQGKSTLATALIERLIDRGFQICVIDPEGDYSKLENTVMLGDEKHPPTSNAILDLLASRENHVVVNMLAIDVADRTTFFAELLPKLANMRAATGRPHWILIDEAHHMLPAARGEVSMTLPRELPATILVTVHPDAVAPAALEAIGVVLAIGDASPGLLKEVCQVMKQDCPVLPAASPGKGEALLWQRTHGEAKLITVEQPRQAHKRHTRKYAEGNLGEDKSFYFRGPKGALNLRAQNVMLFLQIGDGVDDETWLHHLRAGDYSAWFRTAIKDDELADEVAKIETDRQLNIEESRSRLQELVQRRYTLPARP